MRSSRGVRQPVFRSLCLTAACAFSLGGCVPPVLSLAGAALSVVNDNAPAAALSGPFSGAPSAAQNRHQGDPAIGEALAQAEQRQVTEECTAKLPAAGRSPVPGCSIRLVCLPGSTAPLRLRVCSHSPDTGLSEPAFPREPGWKWATSDVSGDTAKTTRTGFAGVR